MPKYLITAIAGLVLICGISKLYEFVSDYMDRQRTRDITKKLSKIPRDDVESGTLLSDRDVYGNQLMFHRDASDIAITQHVASSGKDGQWHTEDDIVSENTDFNKSRIAGKWVGQKSKEFIKGLVSPGSSRFKDN